MTLTISFRLSWGFRELSLIETEEGSSLRNRLEKILKASNRAKDMVRQILTFSRQSEYEKATLKIKINC